MIVAFTVTTTEKVETGFTSFLSVVETERKFDCGVPVLFAQSGRLEALYWLLWRSLNPTASMVDDGPFLQWVATIESYEIETADLPPPVPGGSDGGSS